MKIPNKLNLLFLAVIICLVIALSVRECSHQNLKQEISIPDSTAYFRGKLSEIQARGEAIIIAAKQDSVKTSKALQVLKIENSRLKRSIVPVRVEVDKIADTVAIVKRYLGLVDSTDVNQNAQIDSLTSERNRIWRTMNNLVFNRDEQIQVLTEFNQHQSVINKDLRSKLRKEIRRKTFWKAATAIGATLVLYLAVKE